MLFKTLSFFSQACIFLSTAASICALAPSAFKNIKLTYAATTIIEHLNGIRARSLSGWSSSVPQLFDVAVIRSADCTVRNALRMQSVLAAGVQQLNGREVMLSC